MPIGTQPTAELFAARKERLRTELEKRRLPILVVSSPVNIFYLTGFHGTAGVVLFERSEAVMWVDPRYTLQARGQARGVEVIEARTGLLKAVSGWLKKRRAGVVGYDDLHLSCAEFRGLERESPRTTRWQ